MAYIVIENFKFGLDTRRLDLNSRPGVLIDITNAHIDQGGQVEKRKAFVKTDIVSSISPTVPTKGFQEGVDGIYVFSNFVDPGGWPAPIKMQSLFYPQFHATNTTYITQITVEIDVILYSTVFAGKIFVIAKFVNGEVLAFYDGVPLPDTYEGRKWSAAQLNTGFLADLLVAINNSGFYTGDQPGAAPTTVNLYGLPGRLYYVTISKVSAAGTLTSTLVDSGIAGNPAIAATGTFQIVAGTELAGHYVSQVTVGVTNLLTAPGVLYNDSPERTASDVAAAIIANSGGSGYTAAANGRNVLITATTAGTTPNDLDVTVTTTADVCIGLCKFNFVGSGFSLDFVQVDGVNIMTAVLNYPTPAGETLTAFCIRIVANINANSAVSGYLAASEGSSVFLSKVVTKGSDIDRPVSVGVTPTTGTGAVFVGDVEPFLVSVAPSSLLMVPGPPQGREQAYALYTTIASALATPFGGVPPYTYLWKADQGVQIFTPTSSSTVFRISAPVNTHGGFSAHCEVSDSSGLVASSPQVSLSY